MKNKELARRVRELRKRKGFSQEELAESTGLSLRTIQRVESGETEPNGDTIRRISQRLEVLPEELREQTVTEDFRYLRNMNLSALSFLVFPLLGILVPLILWLSEKSRLKNINTTGKSLLNFEITWFLVLTLGFIIGAVFLVDPKEVSADTIETMLRFQIIFFLAMYSINFFLITLNTFRLSKDKKVIYQPRINFI